MRRLLLFVLMLGLLGATIASAATTCPTLGSGPVTVTPGYSCEVNGLVFSNFTVIPATAGTAANVTLVYASVVGDYVNLYFNPSLTASAGSSSDIWFYFTVSGGVNGIDLSVSGTNATITEYACGSPVTAGNICPAGTELAKFTAQSGGSAYAAFPGGEFAENVYIYKNILVQGGVTAPGELSSFSQSFHIPEPFTFVLMGSGLLAIGLVRRRSRSK